MTSPFRELAEVVEALRALRLAHALIGGWAVIASGAFRTSDDIDLLAELPASARKPLLKALAAGFFAEWREPGEGDPIAGLVRARPRADGLPIDILAAGSAADREVLKRARPVTVEGLTVPVALPEDLIAMKLQAGGGQDYEDARRLLALPSGVDGQLLTESCRKRGVLDRLALIRPPA